MFLNCCIKEFEVRLRTKQAHHHPPPLDMVLGALHRKNIVLHPLQKDIPGHPRILLKDRSVFINILKNIRITQQDLSYSKLRNDANRVSRGFFALILVPCLASIKSLQQPLIRNANNLLWLPDFLVKLKLGNIPEKRAPGTWINQDALALARVEWNPTVLLIENVEYRA